MKSIIAIFSILPLTATASFVPLYDQNVSLPHLQTRGVSCQGSILRNPDYN